MADSLGRSSPQNTGAGHASPFGRRGFWFWVWVCWGPFCRIAPLRGSLLVLWLALSSGGLCMSMRPDCPAAITGSSLKRRTSPL